MRCPELSEDIRAFVGRYLRTLEEVQVLALAHARQDVSIAEIQATLLLTHEHARRVAITLSSRGLLRKCDHDKFQIDVPRHLVSVVSQLAQIYEAEPVALIRLLSANSLARVRSAARATFVRPNKKG